LFNSIIDEHIHPLIDVGNDKSHKENRASTTDALLFIPSL
jgi:hypothetical protein